MPDAAVLVPGRTVTSRTQGRDLLDATFEKRVEFCFRRTGLDLAQGWQQDVEQGLVAELRPASSADNGRGCTTES